MRNRVLLRRGRNDNENNDEKSKAFNHGLKIIEVLKSSQQKYHDALKLASLLIKTDSFRDLSPYFPRPSPYLTIAVRACSPERLFLVFSRVYGNTLTIARRKSSGLATIDLNKKTLQETNLKFKFLVLLFLCLTLSASYLNALEPGNKAPRFELQSVNGEEISLTDFADKLVFIEFWASWCAACKHSLEWLSELQSRYRSQGLIILAINLDQNSGDLQDFLVTHKTDILVLLDPRGQVAKSYDPSNMPGFYLINRKGALLLTHSGFEVKDRDMLETKIKFALEQ